MLYRRRDGIRYVFLSALAAILLFSSTAVFGQATQKMATIDGESRKSESLGSPTVTIGTLFVEENDTLLLPVVVSLIEPPGILAFQGVFNYDQSVIMPEPFPVNPPPTFFQGCVTAGTISNGATATCSYTASGEIRIAISNVFPMSGSGTLIYLQFAAVGPIGSSTVVTASNFFMDEDPPIAVTPGTVIVVDELEPTAGGVTVGGTALGSDGRALYGARVTLMDANGMTRTALTNPFGYFTFSDVPAGESYVISATARGYTFESTLMTIGDEITDIVLVGQR